MTHQYQPSTSKMEDDQREIVSPHVLIFPLPLQGPVNCMLKLAQLLSLSGIQVTFLNTDHIHRCLLAHTDVQSRFSCYPKFRFETVPDGLPEDHPRSGDRFIEMMDAMKQVTEPLFKDMLTSGCLSSRSASPVTIMIPDGCYSFALDISEEIKIPLIYFETISPCGLWTYLCLPKLIQSGELPFKGNDLDAPIKSVPGTEGFLRRRDLPSFCRSDDLSDPFIQLLLKEAKQVPRARGLIINTFETLDATILPHMRSLGPNLYSIGPIHTLLKAKLPIQMPRPTASNSLWEEERSCLSWLDKQPLKSVVYVSIGSLATMTENQLMEIWHGLVNSGKQFLWVRRPGSITAKFEESEIPEELVDGTKERGCIVDWAPQEEVLDHCAIGGFLTHSGWNSTIESIVEGVPMICWPYFVDQQMNSRFVSEVWKLGIDIKDTCDRAIIENTVRDLMDVREDEFMQSANAMAEMAAQSVSEGGSSCINLNRLVDDIRLMSLREK